MIEENNIGKIPQDHEPLKGELTGEGPLINPISWGPASRRSKPKLPNPIHLGTIPAQPKAKLLNPISWGSDPSQDKPPAAEEHKEAVAALMSSPNAESPQEAKSLPVTQWPSNEYISSPGSNLLGQACSMGLTRLSGASQDIIPQGVDNPPNVSLVPISPPGHPQMTVSPVLVPASPSLATPIDSTPVHTGQVINIRTPKITPYRATQELIGMGGLVVSNNAVYFFNGLVYTLLKREALMRLIMERCRATIETVGNAAFLENIYKLLLAEPAICNDNLTISQDEIVFMDGVLDLRTGTFSRVSPAVFATSYLKASYLRGRGMECPLFDKFISDVVKGDDLLATRIWEVLGYCLTQDQRGKCFILLQGPHDTGKSLFGNFLRDCFSEGAVSSLDLHSFGRTFALADLIGKRLCIDLDLPADSITPRSISILKKMTGGDLLTATIKFMPNVNFVNTSKFLFASNHAIVSGARDDAFLRRLVVVPFRHSVPVVKQDCSLGELIASERDNIIVRALQYYYHLRNRNYQFSGDFSTNMAVSGYDDSTDCLLSFLRSEYVEEASGWVSSQSLYDGFSLRFGPRWALNIFSERVNRLLPSLFPEVEKERRRITAGGNPVGGFCGLALKRMDHMNTKDLEVH